MGNCCSQPPATSERPKDTKSSNAGGAPAIPPATDANGSHPFQGEEPAKPAWFGVAADRTGAAPTAGQKAKLVAAI